MKENRAFSQARPRALSVSCALVLAFLSVLFFPGAVLARSYGVADWNAPQNQGGYANLYVAQGSVSDWASGGHINETIWVATSNANTSFQYWAEGGYTYGYQCLNILTYYWAHNSPMYGYGDHQITSITPIVGTWEPIQVKWTGNGTWSITYNWQVATGPDGPSLATGHTLWSYGMQAGLESTSSASSLTNAVASSLQWMDSQGTWQSGWNSAYIYVAPPASASWVTQYQRVTSSQ